MRAVADGRLRMGPGVREHLELCLDCRACESACPSGVQYGKMIEPFKIALQKSATGGEKSSLLQRWILHHLFPYPDRVEAGAGAGAAVRSAWVCSTGPIGPVESALAADPAAHAGACSPSCPGRGAVCPRSCRRSGRSGRGSRCSSVASPTPCSPRPTRRPRVSSRRTGARLSSRAVRSCCGAIHYHSGVEEPALLLARQNIAAFLAAGVDAIIVNAAGCGAMLKDYAHILPADLHDEATQFVAKVKDISEFLMALGPIPPRNAVPLKVTYHDACHLCHGQQIRSQPRALLAMIPGLELVPLEETEICCGAAGTYNLSQPEMSERLGRRKMDHIEATGARMVVTGNVGCILQIARKVKERNSPIDVAHPIDLLDRAYQGEVMPPSGRRDIDLGAGLRTPEGSVPRARHGLSQDGLAAGRAPADTELRDPLPPLLLIRSFRPRGCAKMIGRPETSAFGIYTDRALGSDRDHRGLDCAAFAGRASRRGRRRGVPSASTT